MKRKILWCGLSFLLVAALVLASCGEAVPGEQEEEEEEEVKKPGEGLVIYFQTGGPAGEPYTEAICNGAKLAAEVWGIDLILQTGPADAALMVDQFREAVAVRPDGIVVMGMMGEDTSRPIMEDAMDLGIVVTAYHWLMPAFQEEFKDRGFGFAGMLDWYEVGRGHARATINGAGLKAGDRILLYDHTGPDPRIDLTNGILDYAEEQGMIIEWIINPIEHHIDVEYFASVLAGYLAAHPDTKAVICWHGIFVSESETIFRIAGVTDPDDIWFTSADVTPSAIEALESGWTDCIGDGMLSMQAYTAVQQAVLSILYKVPGMIVNTGTAHLTRENIGEIKALIEAGKR